MYVYVYVYEYVYVHVGIHVYKINITGSASLAEPRIPNQFLVEEYRMDSIFAVRNVVFCAGRRRDDCIQEGKRKEGTVR